MAAVAEKVPPTEKVHEVAHQLLGNKPNEVEVQPVVDDSEEEYTEEVEEEKVGAGKKKLVWENYTKKDLYYHWVKARNDASDLRKDRNDLDGVRKEQVKEIRELKRALKAAETKKQGITQSKYETLQKKLDDEKTKSQREKLEKKTVMENKDIMIKNIQDSYDNMTMKAELEKTASLQQFELKFAECQLKYESKVKEVKALQDRNKELDKKLVKYDNLLFQKSKADLQLKLMEDKCQLR